MLLRLLLSRLFLPSLVLTLLAVGLTAYVRGRTLETDQLLLSRSLACTVDNYLEHASRMLGTAAQVAETSTPEELTPYLQTTWQAYGYFDALYRLDESGVVTVLVPPDPRYQGFDLSRQPYFRQARAQTDMTISQPFTSLRTGQPTVYMAWPLADGGLVVGELNLGALHETITAERGASSQYFVFIADRSGTLLAHPQSDLVAQQANVGHMEIVQRGLTGEATLLYTANGAFVLGSATQVKRTGWVIVAQTPLSVAYGPYVGSMGLTLLLAPLVWLIMLLNYRLHLIQHVVVPLARLSQGADALAAGDFAQSMALTAIPTAFTEVGTLVASFERMSQAIQARQEALRESEEQFRTVADFTYGWEYWIGPEGDYLYVSPSCARITGYRADEFLQDPGLLEKITHPDDRAMVARHAREELGSGEVLPIDFRIITRSGKERWIGHICQPAYGTDGSWLGRRGSNRDITERKRAEETLIRRNRELALLNRTSRAFSSTLDLDQVLTTVLEEVRRLLDVVACSVWLIEPETKELICRHATGSRSETVLGWRLMPGEGLAGWVAHSGESLIVPDTRTDERHFKGVDQRSGVELRSILNVPLRIKQDVIGVLQAVDTEVDRFKSTDLTLLELLAASASIAIDNARLVEALRQRTVELQAHNEALDAFAHTVAHDLKGPLGYMVGFAHVLEEDRAALPEEDLCRYLRMIAQSGRKMSNIIDELLLLASVRKIEEVGTGPLDMASIVAEAQGRLADLIKERQAEIVLAEAWPVALGYGPWVEEVWVNYLSNAIKHGGHPPRVELGATVTSPLAGGTEGGEVRFWVRDNGPGLTPEEQARLFTPFTQLDQVRAKGHGLGLSIVRRIVEKLGGRVGVESQVGQGSVFTFTLPGLQTEGRVASSNGALGCRADNGSLVS